MYFDNCVISHNSKDLHNSLSPLLTAHLSLTNWILSSSFNVFPTIPGPLCSAIFFSPSLSFLLKVQHLSLLHQKLIPASWPCSLQWLQHFLLSQIPLCTPLLTRTTNFILPLSSLFSLPTSQSLLTSLSLPQGSPLYSGEAAVHCMLSPLLRLL